MTSSVNAGIAQLAEQLAPTEYKGKPMDFGGIINISESIMPDGGGIYYLIATGSAYVYADDEGKIKITSLSGMKTTQM